LLESAIDELDLSSVDTTDLISQHFDKETADKLLNETTTKKEKLKILEKLKKGELVELVFKLLS